MKQASVKVLFVILVAFLLCAASIYLYEPPGSEVFSTLDFTHYPFPSNQVKFTNQAVTPNAILWAGTCLNVIPPMGEIQYVLKDPQRWPEGGFPSRLEERPQRRSSRQAMQKTLGSGAMPGAIMDIDEGQLSFPGMGSVTFTGARGYIVYFRTANGHMGEINTFREFPDAPVKVTIK